MRKVLSFVLVLSLVLGSFGMAFAATPAATDIAGKTCEEAVKVLTGLDVVSGYADGTYKPENIVTRGEMATLIVKSLGLNDYAVGTPKFADSKNHWAKGYIAYANSLGIISGRTATTFDPNATVTYDEAATMLVKALGYSDDTLVGTWPTNYVTKAKVLGILDGIKSGAAGANRGDIAIILYQTLDQAIGKVNKDGDWVATATKFDKDGKVKEYDNMLARLGAKVYETTYYKDEDQNFVLTGSEDSIINLTPYKGALVSAYMNTDKEIIAIKEVFSTFVSGTIKKDVLTTADGTEYTLKDDALKAIGTTPSAVYFQNGFEKKMTEDDVKTDGKANYTLSVDLSGKKVNEVYSVNYWKINKADTLDANDIKAIDSNHKLLGVEFDEDNNDDIDLETFELIGVATLEDIKADMVAYVYKNEDTEKISRIAVGVAGAVKGEVTKITSDNTKLTLDGKTYKFADNELSGNGISGAIDPKSVKAGDEVELTLDAYGYIYDSEEISGKADNYAVVLKVEHKEGDKISSDAKLKLMLADGSNKVITADAEDIDDTNVISADGKWDVSKITTGAIVKYGLDKDGVITSLEVDGAASDKDLDVTFVTGEDKADISAKGTYKTFPIAKSAVLFTSEKVYAAAGSAVSSDVDDYGVTTYEKLLESKDVEAMYVLDDDEIVAMVVMDVTSSKDDVYGVAIEWGTNNSDPGADVTMLVNGEKVTKDLEKAKYDSILKGKTSFSELPLFKVVFDADGAIKDLKKFSDIVDDEITTTNASIAVATKAALNGRTFKYDGVKVATLDSDAVVYIWDKDDMEYKSGDTNDLDDMEDGWNAYFYDVYDNDEVYDIVIIEQK